MLRLSTGLRNKLLGDGGAGGSLQDLLGGGVLYCYSDTQPSSADGVETGTLRLVVSLGSAAFVPGAGGASTNGLTFDDAVSAILTKAGAEVWSGVGLTAGTIGWFRFHASEAVEGASTTAVRIDGSIASSGGQIAMSNTTVEVGATVTCTSFNITLPAS